MDGHLQMMDVAVELQYGTLRHGTHSTIQCLEIKSIGTLLIASYWRSPFRLVQREKGERRSHHHPWQSQGADWTLFS